MRAVFLTNSSRSSAQRRSTSVRVYKRDHCVVFSKTKDKFGGLSNMAAGFPLRVNSTHIATSEALYQACRFPNRPDIQRLIIEQHSPMTAKIKSKPFLQYTRPDWDQVRVEVMRWCLRLKLFYNWKKFGDILLSTNELAIVEESRKDSYWGALTHLDTLVGKNVLGRLLMELREEYKESFQEVPIQFLPLNIPNFLLFGESIRPMFSTNVLNGWEMFESPKKFFPTTENITRTPQKHSLRVPLDGNETPVPEPRMWDRPSVNVNAHLTGMEKTEFSADSSTEYKKIAAHSETKVWLDNLFVPLKRLLSNSINQLLRVLRRLF